MEEKIIDQQLEDAANDYITGEEKQSFALTPILRVVKHAFKAGAEWQKDQLSIPTDEEIRKTARALRNEEFEKRKECLAEDLIIDPLSTYEIGIIIGYKQALKDLGYE